MVVRYNSWQDNDSLERQFYRIIEGASTPTYKNDYGNRSPIPAAELTETDDTLYLRFELPGIAAEDLDIQVMAEAVAIAGERKQLKHDRTRSEFRYGTFQRVIPLPARIQNTQVKADFKDGILNLTLPKSEEEKNKVVKVNLS